MTAEQIIIAIILVIAGIAVGLYVAKKTAANSDSLEAEGFDKVSSVVDVLAKMRARIDTDITEANAKKAHLDSSVASFKERVAKL